MNEIVLAQNGKQVEEEKTNFTQMEVNFLQYPIGVLDKNFKFRTEGKDAAKKYVLSFRQEIPLADGIKIIEWRVIGTGLYGLPGPTAVLLDNAITKLIQDRARVQNTVPRWIKTTYYELAKEMGLSDGGQIIARIKNDLKCLVTTSYEQLGAFKTKTSEKPLDNPIIRKYEAINLKGEQLSPEIPDQEHDSSGRAPQVYIVLSSLYWANLRDHYTKGINYGFMMQLRNPVLQRMYQLLSLGFQTKMKWNNLGQPFMNYNYNEFCGRIPIKIWLQPSQALSHIKRYLISLKEAGYISEFVFNHKNKPQVEWYIQFTPGKMAISEIEILAGQKTLFDSLQLKPKRHNGPKALEASIAKADRKQAAKEDGRDREILKEIESLDIETKEGLTIKARAIYEKKYGGCVFSKSAFNLEMIDLFIKQRGKKESDLIDSETEVK